ncbi:MAG: hypothetical protein RL329_794 [Bacteroidota bacterium]|jgi:hypothetical protein
MKMIKIKLIVLLILFNDVLYSQKTLNPIIYVYDTIRIHDTIRIRRPRMSEKLPLHWVEKSLEIPPKTATFSNQSILSSKQLFVPKQNNKMKKNILWAMMLWTLPDLVAQNHWNLAIGGGAHQMKVGNRPLTYIDGDEPVVHFTNPTSHLQVGINWFRYAFNKQFIYGAGLDYHHMFANHFQPVEAYSLYERAQFFKFNWSLWSLPIYAQWNAKFVKPLLGVVLDYKNVSDEWTPTPTPIYFIGTMRIPNSPKPNKELKLSFLAGAEVPLSKKYAVRLNYVHELLGSERWAISWDESYEASNFKIKNDRFELTLVTHLNEW